MPQPVNNVGFHWADYVVFSAALLISAAIGLFAAIKHRKATAEQLLTGNRKLPLLPVSLSLAASFMSAIFVLGVPGEAYVNSTEYWLIGLGYIPAELLTCFLIMPVFYRLKLTSAYQYLEIRFNRLIRILGSLTFTLQMILYMAVVMYAPALALSQVTNLSMDVSILATGLVCTLYTALGGIKAVVWTDAFQMLVILAGFLALNLRGAHNVGGWGVVMDRAFEGGRFTWDLDMDPNPFIRHTFWTLFIGGTMTSLIVYSSNQAMLQRYLSVRSERTAKWAIMIHLPISELFLALAMMSGLVMYATYYGCDPIASGVVAKGDQLIPLFVMQTLGDMPGLPGLFVACVYSAALSTVSSGVNSLAAVTLEDFFKTSLKKLTGGHASSRLYSIVTVGSATFYGLVTIGLAYMAGVMGKTVLQIALSIFGMVGGPLMGLLLVGMFFPCVNCWGAGVGLVCSLGISLWVGLGAIFNPKSAPSALPPLNTLLCNVTDVVVNGTPAVLTSADIVMNGTYTVLSSTAASLTTNDTLGTTMSMPAESDPLVDVWYRLSYQHFGTLAIIISIVVGILVSAVTGFNKNNEVDHRTYYDVLGCCRKKDTQKEQTDLIAQIDLSTNVNTTTRL
ncbi:sodium-coupled monocarboxylate transporter 1-like [Babylonia areolata]|uniref:sodium-coupled monocarboxylate transporter 1-like n=1 Tax=Babylonia areolata TaxID=304850 RepID=UPI003FD34DBD